MISKVLMTTSSVALLMSAATFAHAQGQPNVNRPPQPPPTQGQPNTNRPPAQTPDRRDRQDPKDAQQAAVELPASHYKISELIGMRVDARNGNRIGEISDLAINAENGRIRFAIVDNGEGKLLPIPMPALRLAENRQRAVVDTTTERMKDAATFNPEGWATIGDAKWGAIVYEFYGLERDPDVSREAQKFVPGASIVSSRVETRRNENMGLIRDVVIDTEKNTVAYAAMLHGNDQRLFALPWGAFVFHDGGKRVEVRGLTRDDLRDAPGFAANRWPASRDLKWNDEINYDTKPPTWVYGLQPVQAGGAGGDPVSEGDRGKLGGWQTNGRYGQMFSARTVERLRGTVVRTEKIEPLTGMEPGTALVVRVQGQGNMVVHLGPEWFISRQQENFAAGDEIEFAGSKVDINQQAVVMATQLFVAGRVMTLRNDQGVPVWDIWQERK